jgi:hypothetical protein
MSWNVVLQLSLRGVFLASDQAVSQPCRQTGLYALLESRGAAPPHRPPAGCCKTWMGWTGPTPSRRCSATGSAAARAPTSASASPLERAQPRQVSACCGPGCMLVWVRPAQRRGSSPGCAFGQAVP